jgi:ELWxxDGT repeat protein
MSRLLGLVYAALVAASLLAISADPGAAATKPVLVKDIRPGAAGSWPSDLTNFNGTLVFSANTDADSAELWKSNGTRGGTQVVRRFAVSDGVWYRSPAPAQFTPVGGTLFFTAPEQTILNRELWKTDGTSRGTTLVRDIKPGPDTSRANYLTDVNGTLFFSADDGLHGEELWKSNGSAASTILVKEFSIGAPPSSPGNLTNVNGTLFFTADVDPDPRCSINPRQLFKSDGTAGGTTVVFSDGRDGNGFDPSDLINVSGTLFFNSPVPLTSYCWEHRYERALWRSDGTHDGTTPFIRIAAGPVTNVNGTLFFQVGSGPDSDAELWKSDGTAAGTTLVKKIEGSARDAQLQNMTNVNGTLFFTAYEETNGRELWKSDGTAAGTTLVKDIRTGRESSAASELTDVDGTLFFAAENDTYGVELWKSDGTSAGTSIEDINPGPGHSFPSELTRVKNTLFFRADDGTHGYDLWKIHNPRPPGR